MNCLLRSFVRPLVLLTLASCVAAPGQNLLLINPSFEANTAYYSPAWGYPEGTPDALPGWIITLDPNGDGYAGAAADQSPANLEGAHFGYIYSGTGAAGSLETAPEARAAVTAGVAYNLWFLARGDNLWSSASATVSLSWYLNQTNNDTVGDPTNLDLTLPPYISTADSLEPFHLTAVAPPEARCAGVRVTRPANSYVSLICDGFVVTAEPSEMLLAIKKHGSQTLLSWPRSEKYLLEVTSSPDRTNGWSRVDQPTKSIGATNYVELAPSGIARFFRLTTAE